MKKIIEIFSLMTVAVCLFSCNQEGKDPKATGRFESVNSGTFTCYVDDAVWDLLQEPLRMYDSAYKEIYPKFIKSTSREAMAQLLAGNTQAIITPRDYLQDEDSLMKKYKVVKHERAIFAIDGLVFFTKNNFPTDTLNDLQIKQVLTESNKKLSDFYPQFKSEPLFICPEITSSEWANLNRIVLKGKPTSGKVKLVKDFKEVKEYVRNNNNAVGIGYLSQVVKDFDLKMLNISFKDSTGRYRVAKYPVHQANILRGLYPYPVNHYCYILEKRQDRVFWFAKFMEREFVVQSYFNNFGIVPAFARIELIEQE
jgi:hypothetical protein